VTDNGLAALATAIHVGRNHQHDPRADERPHAHLISEREQEDAAAILRNGAVFLPDGLGPVMVGMAKEIAALRDALEDMVRQFAYWSNSAGGIYTGGLFALEEAFDVLGWDDPYPLPDRRCDEPGCMEDGTMGWPTRPGGTGLNGGYRTTCWDHSDIGKARAILAIINPEEAP